LVLLWAAHGTQWAYNHKVTFDGANRLIIVGAGVTDIDVKIDIYSDWKEWVTLGYNSKYLPAIRTIGGDPAGDGFAGDLYFMQNGWRVEVNTPVDLNGILYSDDFDSPYIINPGGGVTASVSNLAFAVATAAAEVPTVDEIGDEMTVRLQVVLDALEGLALETTAAAALRSAKLAAALSA
tara:strand:+ start:141035 stop:141574 length:540 start_codon:yes stop_codon:yes gene_type:complete